MSKLPESATKGLIYELEQAEAHATELAAENLALKKRVSDLESRTITVRLPDPGSKAFWGGNGKAEVFYPSTYKLWVSEAIERAAIIAGVNVRRRKRKANAR